MAIDRRRGADPLGRAMLEYQHGELGTLTYRDGARTRDGHVRENYFRPREEWSEETVDRLERIESRGGPILDVGCGAGQHALWFQDRGLEVTGIDASPSAVEAVRARGVEDARVMDMFGLEFERERFRAVHVIGTQLGLGGSIDGIRELLATFARVSDDEGVAVVDNYDPTAIDGEDALLGYRPDPREGVARRCFHFEYRPSGDGTDASTDPSLEIGPTLSFLLCSPSRLREATIGTPWEVGDVLQSSGSAHYAAVLEKSGR